MRPYHWPVGAMDWYPRRSRRPQRRFRRTRPEHGRILKQRFQIEISDFRKRVSALAALFHQQSEICKLNLKWLCLALLTLPAIATRGYPRYPLNSETSHELMANLFESPRYIAVEGPIRVGKSTLARILAERLNAQRVMEPEENPFLDSLYEEERGAAFQAQFTFLVRRLEQLQALDLGPS